MKWIGVAIGVAGLIIGVLGVTLFFRIKKEIRRIIAQIEYINTYETNKEVSIGTSLEVLNELGRKINELIQEKKASQQNYIRMDRELREAIANISHDLRTPLTSILGYVQLIEGKVAKCKQAIHEETADKLYSENIGQIVDKEQDGIKADGIEDELEKTESYLTVIKGRSEALNNLVQSFYELSKLSSNGYELENEEIHIERIVCELMATFYQDFVDKNLHLNLVMPEKLPTINGEYRSVERVLMNLIQNTLRYARKEVELKVEEQDEYIVLSLTNEAGEVKAEDLPYLYDRFFMTNRVRSGEGTGIGLAVVKKLMELMDGQATAQLENERLSFILKWRKWV